MIRRLIDTPIDIIRSVIISINYYLNNYKETVWIVGDGRSGTTWLSELINFDKSYREIFEAFHPILEPSINNFKYHQYVHPDDRDYEYYSVANNIFSGRFRNKRVDNDNWKLYYRGIIVKDVFANLLMAWAKNQFPKLKDIFLIRNPFSVALLKYNNRDWYWCTDPQIFLDQNSLVEDYLGPHYDYIKGFKGDYIENQILIWSIIHFIPLKQLTMDDIHVVFYEDLYLDPNKSLNKIYNFIGKNMMRTAL